MEEEMKEVYIVTATTYGNGCVLTEVFRDLDEALNFETRVHDILRTTYSEEMVEDPTLHIGFSKRILHENKVSRQTDRR